MKAGYGTVHEEGETQSLANSEIPKTGGSLITKKRLVAFASGLLIVVLMGLVSQSSFGLSKQSMAAELVEFHNDDCPEIHPDEWPFKAFRTGNNDQMWWLQWKNVPYWAQSTEQIFYGWFLLTGPTGYWVPLDGDNFLINNIKECTKSDANHPAGHWVYYTNAGGQVTDGDPNGRLFYPAEQEMYAKGWEGLEVWRDEIVESSLPFYWDGMGHPDPKKEYKSKKYQIIGAACNPATRGGPGSLCH